MTTHGRKRLSQLEVKLFTFLLQPVRQRLVHRDHSSPITLRSQRRRPPIGYRSCGVDTPASASVIGETEPVRCRSLTWATTPANSSSTRWSRNADTSMNLQPRFMARRIPSKHTRPFQHFTDQHGSQLPLTDPRDMLTHAHHVVHKGGRSVRKGSTGEGVGRRRSPPRRLLPKNREARLIKSRFYQSPNAPKPAFSSSKIENVFREEHSFLPRPLPSGEGTPLPIPHSLGASCTGSQPAGDYKSSTRR